MRNKRNAILIMTLLLITCLLPQQILAKQKAAVPEAAALTIHYADDEPLVGAKFNLYQLGTWNDDAESVQLQEPYDGYGVDVDLTDTSTWKDASSAFQGFILRDKIQPDAQGKIDENGFLTFAHLERGAYLIVGQTHVVNESSYHCEPILLMLPAFDGEHWQETVTVEQKYEKEPLSDKEEKADTRKVLKIWTEKKDEQRPASISIDLLKDGTLYDTVTLSEENQWSHIWSDLPAGHDWQVAEDVPKGYKVKVTREGKSFVVTNTKIPDGTPEKDPEPGTDGTPDQESEPEQDGSEKTEDTLPLTGQPWVIVAGLFATGLFLVLLGIVCRRGGYHES